MMFLIFGEGHTTGLIVSARAYPQYVLKKTGNQFSKICTTNFLSLYVLFRTPGARTKGPLPPDGDLKENWFLLFSN
jgi:hypothetical protein